MQKRFQFVPNMKRKYSQLDDVQTFRSGSSDSEPMRKRTKSVVEFERLCPREHPLCESFLLKFRCALCQKQFKREKLYACRQCKYTACINCFDGNESEDSMHLERLRSEEEYAFQNTRRVRPLSKLEWKVYGGKWMASIPAINQREEEMDVKRDARVFTCGVDTMCRLDLDRQQLWSLDHHDVWTLVRFDKAFANAYFACGPEKMIWRRSKKKMKENIQMIKNSTVPIKKAKSSRKFSLW